MNLRLFGCIFVLLLFLSGISNAELPSPSLRANRKPSVLVSGDLTTKDSHHCSWYTSGASLAHLLFSCTSQQSYWCRYDGKRHLCPAHGVKLFQYWKQVVGKLKKRRNTCEGEKVLRAKTCKKLSTKTHMKLTQSSDVEVRKSKNDKPQTGDEVGADKEKMEVMTMTLLKKSAERVKKDLEPVERYCSQGWSSICTFFHALLQAPGSF